MMIMLTKITVTGNEEFAMMIMDIKVNDGHFGLSNGTKAGIGMEVRAIEKQWMEWK